ncbi:MAG: group II intron reverse transcriptase/maturase [Candidatus Altiarchaeota archaeon]
MEKKRKVHSLTGRITPQMMKDAFKAVKRNRGACGIDKVSIQLFENQLEQNLDALMKKLKGRSYAPLPLRRAYIPKGKNQRRPLGIPSVRDRIAQEVIRRLLEPIFERKFHNDSFGFRRRRNCHKAVERVIELCQKGYIYVMDADIAAFFDNIPHSLIMKAVAEEVADGNILSIVEKFLTSGVMEDGKFVPTRKGTPQGGVISPLLANIVLNYLDWHLEKHGYHFTRYADDFVVLCQNKNEAERALNLVKDFLAKELSLSLSIEKTKVTTYHKGFEFLGFFISSRSTKIRTKSVEKFKDKVKELTIRSHNLDQEVIKKLNQVIRGTANYFATSFSNCYHLFNKTDMWIRRRLRCMKYKSISRRHNLSMRTRHIHRLGLLSLADFCPNVKERK